MDHNKSNALDILALREEYGPVFVRLLERVRGDVLTAVMHMINTYAGEFSNLGDYAFSHHGGLHEEELRTLPTYITNHIDWEDVGRELLEEGGIVILECDGAIHVFHSEM